MRLFLDVVEALNTFGISWVMVQEQFILGYTFVAVTATIHVNT